MTDYRPVLYHSLLSAECVRALRAVDGYPELEVQLKNITLSLRNRRELRERAGSLSVPCLVMSSTVIRGADEIRRYLQLRFGG